MRKTQKFLVVFCTVIMFFNSLGTAEASTKKPSNIWDWGNGSYSFHGTADRNDLYSNYYFKNIEKVSITVNNVSTKFTVVVRLKSVEPWYKSDKTVSYATIPADGECTWTVSSLDKSKKYYLVFESPCNFSGNISRK